MLLGLMPDELRDDGWVVHAAMKQQLSVVRYASDRLLVDRGFVMAAVRRDGMMLCHAAPVLHSDREVVLTAISQCGRAFEYADVTLQGDEEIAMRAVADYGQALRHASGQLRDNRSIVLTAVRNNGFALKWASNRLRRDREIIIAAGGSGFEFADGSLRGDKQVCIELIRTGVDSSFLRHASHRLRADREACMEFLQEGASGRFLRYLKPWLRDDTELVLGALRRTEGLDEGEDEDGYLHEVLESVSPRLRDNYDLANEVVVRDPGCFELLSERLRGHPDIVSLAVEQAAEFDRKYTEEYKYDVDYMRHFNRGDVPHLVPDILLSLGPCTKENESIYKELRAEYPLYMSEEEKAKYNLWAEPEEKR
jgi:hypothetical protein